jgi:hypothetical protein
MHSSTKWFVLATVVLAGMAVTTLSKKKPEPEAPKLTVIAPKQTVHDAASSGWSEIRQCTPFTSADGKTELSFRHNRTMKRDSALGSWSYDAASKRYVVSVGLEIDSYELFHHDGVELCILIDGTTEVAKLEFSWFSNYRQVGSDDTETHEMSEPEPRGRFR